MAKERPILFDGESVRAIIEGRKTQTRRVKKRERCPYNKGDVLWVRETWCHGLADHECWGYKATMTYQCGEPIPNNGEHKTWKPSIFMPKRYSRLRLLVEDVKVEPLQDITSEDVEAEGVHSQCFAERWDSINAKRGYSWESNPVVWVVTFSLLERKDNHDNTMQET